MSVHVEGIGTQKISYRNPAEIEFSDLSDYMLMAKKSISKFANRFYNGLSKRMLKDEDAISSVAYCLMLADWRYDENYKSKHNSKKTHYSYRNQCAIWAIQSYLTKNYKKSNLNYQKMYSLDYVTDKENGNTAYNYISDKNSHNPIDLLEKDEEDNRLKNYVLTILSVSSISEKQKEYIRMYYYEGKTFEQIGKKFSLTREAIRQSIKKAIKTIRETNSLEVSQHEHF